MLLWFELWSNFDLSLCSNRSKEWENRKGFAALLLVEASTGAAALQKVQDGRTSESRTISILIRYKANTESWQVRLKRIFWKFEIPWKSFKIRNLQLDCHAVVLSCRCGCADQGSLCCWAVAFCSREVATDHTRVPGFWKDTGSRTSNLNDIPPLWARAKLQEHCDGERTSLDIHNGHQHSHSEALPTRGDSYEIQTSTLTFSCNSSFPMLHPVSQDFYSCPFRCWRFLGTAVLGFSTRARSCITWTKKTLEKTQRSFFSTWEEGIVSGYFTPWEQNITDMFSDTYSHIISGAFRKCNWQRLLTPIPQFWYILCSYWFKNGCAVRFLRCAVVGFALFLKALKLFLRPVARRDVREIHPRTWREGARGAGVVQEGSKFAPPQSLRRYWNGGFQRLPGVLWERYQC